MLFFVQPLFFLLLGSMSEKVIMTYFEIPNENLDIFYYEI